MDMRASNANIDHLSNTQIGCDGDSTNPFDKLPDEILAEIFCLNLGNLTISSDSDFRLESPVFTLMKVCRRWHSVAIFTPALWSRLWLDLESLERFYDDEDQAARAFEEFTKMCLERSAGHLLDVGIGDIPHLKKFSWIMATSNRWKSLNVENKDLCVIMACPDFQGLPLLRSLKLYCWKAGTPPHHPTRLPHLASLHLPMGVRGLFLVDLSNSPLTHLVVRPRHNEGVLALANQLSTMLNVTHLYLHRFTTSPTQTLPSDVIFDLRSVKNLSITCSPNRVWYILSHSRLPSLTDLRIEEHNDSHDPIDDKWVEDAVVRFTSSCPTELQSFSADSMDFMRFKKVVLALKPRTVVFSSVIEDGSDELVLLVRDIVRDEAAVSRVEEISIFNGSQSSAFLLSLVASLEHLGASNEDRPAAAPGSDDNCSTSSAPKRIDFHSGGPVPTQVVDTLNALFADTSSRGVRVKAHYSPDRAGRLCRLPQCHWKARESSIYASLQHST